MYRIRGLKSPRKWTGVIENDSLLPCGNNYWGVIVEVEVEFDPPDHTVGYRGGGSLNGHEVQTFYITDDDGTEVKRMTRAEFQKSDPDTFLKVCGVADQYINHIERSIIETAAKELTAQDESAQEDAAERRWEGRRMR